ncbi:MAG TPA: hypothetical protein VFC19_17915 [Candidatus Limnocylindrales bacterium]|nr:hypothetical protein [Candidatus Limnocylindrales bacterium]
MSIKPMDDAQRAIAAHALEWTDRALSTEPVDWQRWLTGVRGCYDHISVRWPGNVVRVSSPLAMARALFLARVDETPGDEGRALIGMVRGLVQDRVDGLLSKFSDRAQVTRALHRVHSPVEAAVGGDAVAQAVEHAFATGPGIRDPHDTQESARAAARRIAPSTVRLGRAGQMANRSSAWQLHLGGQWDSAWCAYATYLAGVVGGDTRKGWRRRLQALVDAQSAGWWWPHLSFVMVSDRPRVVRTEELGDGLRRLHNADGPALVWPDGWSLYFWHGTRVPAWVVEKPTVDAIHAEANVEVRRCGIESMGWEAYLTKARLRLIDTAADPGNDGFELRLYEVPAAVWGMPARVLLAINGSPERDGTRRRYGLPVPADMDTAVHAAAWTYGISQDQYAGLARRT